MAVPSINPKEIATLDGIDNVISAYKRALEFYYAHQASPKTTPNPYPLQAHEIINLNDGISYLTNLKNKMFQAPNKVILNNDIPGPPTLPYFVPEPVISEQVQAPNKVIENNQIIGPPLVSGQTNKIPILPIVAGVGIIILAVALSKRKKR